MKTISNQDSIIDSREVIERLEQLESDIQDQLDEYNEENPDEHPDVLEYNELKALSDEGEASPDWRYGETLIRDDYFTDYCQELLQGIGDLPKDLPWYIAIDWEETADNIKNDYFSVDFGGVTYWIRG